MSSTYLVLGATGRQGSACVRALVAKGAKSIVITSRNPESDAVKKLLELEGVEKALAVDLNDPTSITNAITESGAQAVWFTTDYWSIPSATRAKEAKMGMDVIDAIKASDNSIKHVVFSSVVYADGCPENVQHFWGKADIEAYMKSELEGTGITWSIIRPAAFFENYDDPKNFNPLKKGSAKMLVQPDCKLVYVACEDIGKGSAEMLLSAQKYAGKVIDAIGAVHTGPEVADALTKASGVTSTYSVAVPRFIMRCLMKDLCAMCEFYESDDCPEVTDEIVEFKKLVPDAMDAEAWFKSKGKWGNGEPFP